MKLRLAQMSKGAHRDDCSGCPACSTQMAEIYGRWSANGELRGGAADDDPYSNPPNTYAPDLAKLRAAGRAEPLPPVDARTGDDVYSKPPDGYAHGLEVLRRNKEER
jgi:hypothetical protein